MRPPEEYDEIVSLPSVTQRVPSGLLKALVVITGAGAIACISRNAQAEDRPPAGLVAAPEVAKGDVSEIDVDITGTVVSRSLKRSGEVTVETKRVASEREEKSHVEKSVDREIPLSGTPDGLQNQKVRVKLNGERKPGGLFSGKLHIKVPRIVLDNAGSAIKFKDSIEGPLTPTDVKALRDLFAALGGSGPFFGVNGDFIGRLLQDSQGKTDGEIDAEQDGGTDDNDVFNKTIDISITFDRPISDINDLLLQLGQNGEPTPEGGAAGPCPPKTPEHGINIAAPLFTISGHVSDISIPDPFAIAPSALNLVFETEEQMPAKDISFRVSPPDALGVVKVELIMTKDGKPEVTHITQGIVDPEGNQQEWTFFRVKPEPPPAPPVAAAKPAAKPAPAAKATAPKEPEIGTKAGSRMALEITIAPKENKLVISSLGGSKALLEKIFGPAGKLEIEIYNTKFDLTKLKGGGVTGAIEWQIDQVTGKTIPVLQVDMENVALHDADFNQVMTLLHVTVIPQRKQGFVRIKERLAFPEVHLTVNFGARTLIDGALTLPHTPPPATAKKPDAAAKKGKVQPALEPIPALEIVVQGTKRRKKVPGTKTAAAYEMDILDNGHATVRLRMPLESLDASGLQKAILKARGLLVSGIDEIGGSPR